MIYTMFCLLGWSKKPYIKILITSRINLDKLMQAYRVGYVVNKKDRSRICERSRI